jgi:F0F1-type ATP synthase membrane subunit a
MGEHGTWFDYLYRFHGWENFSHSLQASLGRESGLVLFPTHWTLTHVLVAGLVVTFVAYGAARFHASVSGGGQAALIPPRTFNIRHMFELLCDAILGMMSGVMGEKNAKRFFPVIASLAFFILFGNLAALIPGFAPATDTTTASRSTAPRTSSTSSGPCRRWRG